MTSAPVLLVGAGCTEHTRADAPTVSLGMSQPARGASPAAGSAASGGGGVPVHGDPTLVPGAARRAAHTVVWITGDVLISEGMRRVIEGEAALEGTEADAYTRILAPVAEWFARDPESFVFANLESPVATRRNTIDRSTWGGERLVAIPLNMPAYVLEGLRRTGVDGLMLSNNHALDQGEEGLVETLAAAHEHGFVTSGAGHHPRTSWPVLIGEEGARITLVPFYDGHRNGRLEPGTPALADLSEASIAAFAALRTNTELLIPVVHVLGEAVDQPKPRWREWARALAVGGADVIVVHGTHVPLPIEQLVVGERRVPIIWGLGNFVGDMARQATPRRDYYRGMPKDQNPMLREGLVVRVELREGQPMALRFLPLWMNDDRYVRFWGGFERAPRFRLTPLAACGPPLEPPADWPGELREEMMRWIARRRDHLVSHAGLSTDGCRPGVADLLQATALTP
ncbi:MAG: CapA family protein [Polyangiales bacterium]